MSREFDREQNLTLPSAINGRALLGFLIVTGVLISVKQTFLPHSFLYAGPISTLSGMLAASIVLHWQGITWHDLGLRRPSNWLRLSAQTALTIFVFLLSMELMELLADQWFERKGASGRFDHIEGNLGAYLIIMIMTWTHAALFEELLFRAFVISSFSRFLGGGMRADLLAALVSAAFFGYRHYYYQGMHGALVTGAAGLAFAGLYLWFGKRNILPLVLAHGLVNSLGMTLRFVGGTD